MIEGKNPSIFEKLWVVVFGLSLVLLVMLARSRAIISPRTVTIRALNFMYVGMVMMGVLVGRKFIIIR